MGTEAGDVAPRMHLGEPRRDVHESTRVLRVNMIRARGGEVEIKEEEPRFGRSRAAPLQGADCGRPSRSANEGGANEETDESETEGRPRACRRHRRLPEVPYSTASSEERYHGTDGGSRLRAKTPETNSKTNSKTSTLVPEVGYEFGYGMSRTPASSSVDTTDDDCLDLRNDETCRETDSADQDPWSKAMYGVLEQPEQRRGAESERTDREVSYQRYQDVLDEGFLFNRPVEQQRGDGPPLRVAQGTGGRPPSKADFRQDQRGAPGRPRRLFGDNEQTRGGQPSKACSSLIQESLLEEVAARGWIEDRRRPKATYNEETDWRFQGVVGQASRLPRAGTPAAVGASRLEEVVREMQRFFANLHDRITAMETSSNRSGRSRTSEQPPPMRAGAGRSEPDSSSDGGPRRPRPRREAGPPSKGPGGQ